MNRWGKYYKSIAYTALALWLLVLGFEFHGYRQDKDSQNVETLIRTTAQTWVDGVNRRDLAAATAMFSNELVVNYDGVPYSRGMIEQDFKESFRQDAAYRYQYSMTVDEVVVSGGMANAKHTMDYSIYHRDGKVEKGREIMSAMWQKEADDQWRVRRAFISNIQAPK